jgi:hypothetical protein
MKSCELAVALLPTKSSFSVFSALSVVRFQGNLPGAPRHTGFDRLDQYKLGKLFANGEAGVADLANEIGLAGQKPYDLIFAETQLPQAVLHFGRGTKLLDPDRHPGLNPAQRTAFALGFSPGLALRISEPIHTTLLSFFDIAKRTTQILPYCWHNLYCPGRQRLDLSQTSGKLISST